MKENYINQLYTSEGEALCGVAWNVYPRPQMRRDTWMCLNGEWDFEHLGKRSKIVVPFCPESLLSGYEGEISYGDVMTYRRKFTVPENMMGRRVLLCFGAVSRECEVFVNGNKVCESNNAYLPFSADITDALTSGENTLTVNVSNDLSPVYPYGKQKIRRGGMWYTPSSGIWQTVWLESVPKEHIESIKITPDMRGATIEIVGALSGVAVCDGREYEISGGKVRIEPDDAQLWSPEHPTLYDVTIKCGEDEVRSYFALRELSVKEVGGTQRLCLNGVPYFFCGLLDQGYFSDGIYTPASPSVYTDDILKMKSLGFNTLRKHIKIEPEIFYYECDRLGMVVFQDMVNNGKYRFVHDTLLPTVFSKSRRDEKMNKDARTREVFIESTRRAVNALYSHPCICLWTIFNEGWGQFCADEMYAQIKKLDGTRFVDATSGWFWQKGSDVVSLHTYFGKLCLDKDKSRPQILSEFGGYVYKSDEHSFNTKKTYGYKIFKKPSDFISALRGVYENEIIPLAKAGLCAAIYTQLSDVEDETNGILTYDRKIMKVEPSDLCDVISKLCDAVRE